MRSVKFSQLGKIISLAIFLMVLFTSGQRLYSQWELIDTVWTNSYYFFDGDHTSFISPNDSLLTQVLYLINSSTGQGFADDEFYDKDDYIYTHINCFMGDTTILVMKSNTASGANPYDTAKVYDFKNHRYMGIFDIKNLGIPYNQHTINKNLYSRYDNCLYGLTQKMNMTTGEITNFAPGYYYHAYTISPDGTIMVGYWYNGKWENGEYYYDVKMQAISLVTGEEIMKILLGSARDKNGSYDFYFSDDSRYMCSYTTVFDLQTGQRVFSKIAGKDENGMKYSYSRLIFSKSSKKVLSYRYYRGNVQSGMLDSIMISVIDLATQRETLYPLYIEGMVLGEPKAFVFDDYHIICNGAGLYKKNEKGYYGGITLGWSCMLKLKFDVNGVSTEPEEIESVIYPNPTNGEAIIKFLEPINFPTHLQVSNTNGEIIFTDELQVGIFEYRLNTIGWQSGTYYIMTSTETGSKTYKLILNK